MLAIITTAQIGLSPPNNKLKNVEKKEKSDGQCIIKILITDIHRSVYETDERGHNGKNHKIYKFISRYSCFKSNYYQQQK